MNEQQFSIGDLLWSVTLLSAALGCLNLSQRIPNWPVGSTCLMVAAGLLVIWAAGGTGPRRAS